MHHHLSAIILEYKKTTLRGPLLYFGLVFFKSILFFTWVGVVFFAYAFKPVCLIPLPCSTIFGCTLVLSSAIFLPLAQVCFRDLLSQFFKPKCPNLVTEFLAEALP